jgi:hypothetical protein
MWCEAFSIKEYLEKRKFPLFIKKYSKNIYLFYPTLLIPFRRFGKITNLNEKLSVFLLKIFVKFLEIKNHFSKKVLWIFDPHLYPLSQIFGSDYFLLYDCVDFFSGTAKTEEVKKLLVKYEHELTKKANLVTANSTVLQNHLQKIRKDIHLVPQGFRVNSFKKLSNNIPKINRAGRPLIGYLGAVNYRIDFNLLYKLATNNPKWDFAVWGPILEKDLLTAAQKGLLKKLIDLPNVIRGESDKTSILGIIKQFDIGIIPYNSSIDFNKYCYPMKLFEYFYLGKPVVSTPIVELKRFPKFVKIGSNYEEWQKNINSILNKSWPHSNITEERILANNNSWEKKVAKICSYI